MTLTNAPKYPLNRHLTVHFEAPGGVSADAQVSHVTQPLDSFGVHSVGALPADAEMDFAFLLGRVRLVAGRARTLAVQEDRGIFRCELQVTRLAEQSEHDVSDRLAPFVEPRSRLAYLTAGVPELGDQINRLGPWIESTSRLYLLVELIARINSTRDTGTLLHSVMEAAREIMEAEASSLLLLEPETGDLILSIPTGPASAEISGARLPKGKGFAGWVVEHGQPVLTADAQADPRFFGDIAGSGFKTRDLISVPLRSTDGETIGVLQAVNRTGGKPFDERDLPIFTALANQAAIAIERDRLTQEALRRQLLEQELTLASEIQKGFWPKTIPSHPGFDFWGMSLPAAHVGGDYYDFIELDSAQVGLVVADVSGKGVAAALLMASLRSVLRAQVENRHPIQETLTLVNNTLVGDTPSSKFVTLFFGILDCATRELVYVNAGHNPPLLHDSASGAVKLLEIGGPIVGFRAGLPFQAGREKLEPGQVLTIFSDGVTEAQNRNEDFFGDERLDQVIRAHIDRPAQEIVRQIHAAVKTFAKGAPQSDDITLVVVRAE